jgi:hypothetical protein
MTPNRELRVSVKDMWVDDDGVPCIDAASLPEEIRSKRDLIGYDVWINDLKDPKSPLAVACRSGKIAVAQRH